MDGLVLVYNIIFYEIIGIIFYRMVFGNEVFIFLNIMIEINVIEEELLNNELVYVRKLELELVIIGEIVWEVIGKIF